MKRIKRVYRPWTECEEYRTRMWKQVPIDERAGCIESSRLLMLDPAAFEAAMKRAVTEWPNSTEVTLSAPTMNHQAWMGHAGCAINHDAPEDLTRLAWRMLTLEQQDAANLAAENAIAFWRQQYTETMNA